MKLRENESLFVTAVHNIQPAIGFHEVEIVPGVLKITKDKSVLAKIKSQHHIAKIGQLEWDSLNTASLLAVATPPDETMKSDKNGRDIVVMLLQALRYWAVSFWVLRDHCMHSEMGFLFKGSSYVHSNYLTDSTSSASGEILSSEINKSDAEQASKIYLEHLHETAFGGVARLTKTSESMAGGFVGFHEKLGLIWRCLYYIELARSTREIGQKVAFYCTCLESLFSTDNQELKHKVAERAAWFHGEDSADRLKIYSTIGVAYNTRSKVFHGDVITNKDKEKIVKLVLDMDHLLRSIIQEILFDPAELVRFQSSREARNAWFLSLCLGANVGKK